MALLSVRGLTTSFATERGRVRAASNVSFEVNAGEMMGLVGESGCGKSVTALSIMRLLAEPQAHYDAGVIEFEGRDLLKLKSREMQAIRGDRISMIFQEPMTSLNPVYTVGAQIIEAVRLHRKTTAREARQRARELLVQVGIPSPDENLDAYPHQLSGGMRQRVMIAMALACQPALLIADEPTTALDVTIQAQILELIAELRRAQNLAVILITHDLALVAEYTDKVCVMYGGEIVEQAPVNELFARPRHPYTRGLLGSLPRRGTSRVTGARTRLATIEGMVPSLDALPTGCRFGERCTMAKPDCATQAIPLVDVDDASTAMPHRSRCLYWKDL